MRTNSKSWPIALLLCGVAGAGFVAGNSDAGASAVHLFKGGEQIARRTGALCNIKGSVSTTGERIYHIPGQRHYDDAIISRIYGERYFCSEAEARKAGWRRSSI